MYGLTALLSLLIITAVAAAPVPSVTPTPLASPRQLREIGRIRASVCANIVVHANSAISSTLRNDATLALTLATLRKTDLDSADPLTYRNSVGDLERLAAALYDNSLRGLNEVQRLHDLANTSADATRKADLEAFAGALGSALNRQKQAGADLNSYVTYLQARDVRKTPDLDRAVVVEGFTPSPKQPAELNMVSAASPFALWNDSRGTLKGMSQNAASDFEQRAKDVARDEAVAQAHAEGAVSGC